MLGILETMKTLRLTSISIAAALSMPSIQAQDTPPNPYLSIQNEITQSVARGNLWLKEQQNEKGYWGDPGLPAITALVLTAAVRDPSVDLSKPTRVKT